MKTKLTVETNMEGRTFTLHISRADLMAVDLTPEDRQLFDGSNLTVADRLSGIAMLLRRIEASRQIQRSPAKAVKRNQWRIAVAWAAIVTVMVGIVVLLPILLDIAIELSAPVTKVMP